MKLYVGNAYWPDTQNKKIKYSPLNQNIETDVLVIGGGISGMISAFKASEYKDTIIIDKGSIAMESTSLNTGLIQYMSDDILYKMKKDHGEKIGEHFYKLSFKALDNIEEIARILPYETEFKRNSSILLSNKIKEKNLIKSEKESEKKINLDTNILNEKELKAIGLNGKFGLITKNDIELNPYKFVESMGRLRTEEGKLRIFENTEAKSIDFENQKVFCNGNYIKYKFLIIATGYNFLEEIIPYIKDAKLIRTFALVTSPMAEETVNKLGYMVWNTEDPYFYFKKTVRGNIIIGGSDDNNLNLNEKDLKRKIETLKKQFKKIRGIELNNIPWTYSAIFGESKTGLPYIGTHPSYKNVFIIHGIGGNGTVYSSLGSMFIKKFLNGESLREISYLKPGRS